MPNFRNKYTATTCLNVRLSMTDYTYLEELANRSQTKMGNYLEELIEAALMEKRNPDHEPNFFQRLETESAVCGSGVER